MRNVLDNGKARFCYKTDLEHRLGVGAFGEVYRGRQVTDDQVVAIKRIKSNKEQTKQLELFLNEIVILNRLNHQNLTKIYFHTQTANNCYIVMEYCSGGSLRKQLQEKIYYPEDEARPIFRQILAGYRQLYESKIVHRDIKPENILFDSNQVAKIADFGTSRIMEDYSEAQMQTEVGTYQYMAPQVIQRHYSNKADVWSLGVTFYEVLYGQRPWEVQDQNQLQQFNQQIQLEFPNQPVVSEQMQQIIVKMLKYSEQDRMSCEDLLESEI